MSIIQEIETYCRENNCKPSYLFGSIGISPANFYFWKQKEPKPKNKNVRKMREFMSKTEPKLTKAVPLTKREVFALRIACALLQNPKVTRGNWHGVIKPVHEAAVNAADKLLAELSKTDASNCPF